MFHDKIAGVGGHGHNLLWNWVSGVSSTNHQYVLHSCTAWVGTCGVSLPDHQAASLKSDLASWLRPASWLALQAMQIWLGWGPCFTCIEHGTPDTIIAKSTFAGDGQSAEGGTDRISLNLPRVKCFFYSSEFNPHPHPPSRISSRQSNRRWHQLKILLTHCDLCHWFAINWLDLLSIPFTTVAGIILWTARETTAFAVALTGKPTTENGVCADAIETHTTRVFAKLQEHIESRPKYQDLGFAHVDPKSLSFHVSLPEDQFLLQFIQRVIDDDHVICVRVFTGTSCMKFLGEGFQNHDGQ